MMSNSQRRIAELEEKLHQACWDEDYGCHNRKGLELLVWPEVKTRARWLVFFDLDHLHDLNTKMGGYTPVNAMISQVLSVVRSSDHKACRWQSGDELLIVITETDTRKADDISVAEGMVRRLQEAFAALGMSATFAIAPVKSTDLAENVAPAVDKVFEAKKARGVSR
jgi:GGDEF domain-containing protein